MTDSSIAVQSHHVGLAQHVGTAPTVPTFRAVFEEGFAYVFHSLRRLGVHEADLEDIAHESFLIVNNKLAEYQPERPLKAWLFGIAFRVASDYRKKVRRRREQVLDDVREAVDPAPPPEAQLVDAQRQKLVLDALAYLDDDKRVVLVMHDIDGYAMPIVADTLGIPLNTAYSRLRLARGDFRKAVQRICLQRGEP